MSSINRALRERQTFVNVSTAKFAIIFELCKFYRVFLEKHRSVDCFSILEG